MRGRDGSGYCACSGFGASAVPVSALADLSFACDRVRVVSGLSVGRVVVGGWFPRNLFCATADATGAQARGCAFARRVVAASVAVVPADVQVGLCQVAES